MNNTTTLTLTTMNAIELQELVNAGAFKHHHDAMGKGYISVKDDLTVLPYSGKFGTGYKVIRANLRAAVRRGIYGKQTSNRYYRIEYYTAI